jgi:hypothetical protein
LERDQTLCLPSMVEQNQTSQNGVQPPYSKTVPKGNAVTTRPSRCFRRWLLPVLAEWGTIVLLFAAGYALNHWLAWALVVVLLGSRQHALSILGHDGAHHLPTRNRRLNDLASQWLCFWPLMVGLRGYRNFHFRHHRHVTDLDPERLYYHHWSRSQWTLPRTRARLILTFLLDLCGAGVLEVVKTLVLMGRAGWWDWVGPLLWWGVVGPVRDRPLAGRGDLVRGDVHLPVGLLPAADLERARRHRRHAPRHGHLEATAADHAAQHLVSSRAPPAPGSPVLATAGAETIGREGRHALLPLRVVRNGPESPRPGA